VSLSPQFLDDLRARTTLSALIGRSVKLTKGGREVKGLCPFHSEKTPSFTVNDEKAFYHCFSCSAHGDAIRWLTDHEGLAFMDAVRQLADAAGIAVPARSPEAARREADVAGTASVLEAAAGWYAERLAGEPKMLAALDARGVGQDAIARFGLGFAPPKASVAGCGVAPATLEAAGLLIPDQGSGLWRDRFRGRFMIPIHDARGRLAGFAGRLTGGDDRAAAASKANAPPKYLNSPESPHFAKGDLLFNLHRAAPAARCARRLILVEGQFDAIAMDGAGIGEVVAPQGTALTDRQLERTWRVNECPILLFDGDDAGRKAALRACERAMAHVGPGRSLRIALLPDGEDPDSLIRAAGSAEAGRGAIEGVIAQAAPMARWLWETLRAAADVAAPEGKAALWSRLAGLARAVKDAETRAQYLADWRSRFDAAFPPPPPGLTEEEMLPDGRVADFSDLKGVERARLESVAGVWLGRALERLPDRLAPLSTRAAAQAAGRWAWELGRRAGADLVEAGECGDALDEIGVTRGGLDVEQLRRSFWIGCRRAGSIVEAMLLDMRCALIHRTDKGNSERWFQRFGQDYLYTTAKGWLGWDKRRYRLLNQEKDTTPADVLKSVCAMIEAIQREAEFVRDSGWPEDEEIAPDLLAELEQDPRAAGGLDRLVRAGKKAERLSVKLAAWALASEAAGRINCIPGLVKRDVTVELGEFDTDPMLLNCMNGTLRFLCADDDGPARAELRPHDRADRLTKITPCDYDQNAAAPLFQGVVKWAQPDRDRRRYLRQWLGYNLTGDMGEQIFHIWYGPLAANGKSTIGNICREAAGDYGDITNVETFLDEGPKKKGDAATPDLVRLPGVRFVTASEPPKGAKVNEPLINSVTGGDPMLARDNFRSFFRFSPIFKFTLWCNDLPAIPQGTAGIWRRVKVIPWEQHLAEGERDGDLPVKLRAEYAGVLAWMVRGTIDWMEHGFVEPESVQLASADYKQDSDPLSSFLRLCTQADPQGRVQSSHLYETFCAWAKAAGETEWKQKGFSQALKAKGLASKASNGMHWLGITMVRSAGDFIDSDGKVIGLDRLADPAADVPAGIAPRPPPAGDDDFIPGFD
jgi:DNA primase catalytic core